MSKEFQYPPQLRLDYAVADIHFRKRSFASLDNRLSASNDRFQRSIDQNRSFKVIGNIPFIASSSEDICAIYWNN
ncbi:hypothetical protein, partial [Citrobacter freundii]|uniref:hypothetical protein n=1 Tax=Citrobacter freundii TaxID=546 RepID=UPI001F2F6946